MHRSMQDEKEHIAIKLKSCFCEHKGISWKVDGIKRNICDNMIKCYYGMD